MSLMSVEAFTTPVFKVGSDIVQFIVQNVPKEKVHSGMILAITSKVVSLAEGRLVSPDKIEKEDLIKQEADIYLGPVGYGCFLTIKHGLFIASAGIDESNSSEGEYILYPEDPYKSARELGRELQKRWNISHLGIILTDSHTTPLRRGVTGIALSYWGFRGVQNRIGQPDLFGRPLQMTTVNWVDSLAVAATLMMGEANEARPLAILKVPEVEFLDEIQPEELIMPLESDLYFPFFSKSLPGKIGFGS